MRMHFARSRAHLSAILTITMLLGGISVASQVAAGERSIASPETHYFDTDRDVWLIDTDGDGTVDLTEDMDGTNPLDSKDFYGSTPNEQNLEPSVEKAGFPTASCRSGFRQAGSRLCISPDEENQRRNHDASQFCRVKKSRVCTYEDLYYLYRHSTLDASYNPRNIWLGVTQRDDVSVCGNRDITFNNDPDIGNFDGDCLKQTPRQFYCCHDRE